MPRRPSLLAIDARTGRAKALGKGGVVVTVKAPGNDQGAAQLIIDVTDVAIVKSSIQSQVLETCIVDLISKIGFPEIPRDLDWSYTFAFEAF